MNARRSTDLPGSSGSHIVASRKSADAVVLPSGIATVNRECRHQQQALQVIAAGSVRAPRRRSSSTTPPRSPAQTTASGITPGLSTAHRQRLPRVTGGWQQRPHTDDPPRRRQSKTSGRRHVVIRNP
jgi:hypothetical protein